MDFDIVNPFFRTADAKGVLEQAGVTVMLPQYANTNVEIPSLPYEINTVFEDNRLAAVFDAGGDDLGAKAVARYKKDFEKSDYDLFLLSIPIVP